MNTNLPPCRHRTFTHGCTYCALDRDNPRVRNHWRGTSEPVPAPQPVAGQEVRPGVGTELRALLGSIGLHPTGCRCNERARLMDQWGVQGCRERREEIVAWLKGEHERLGWGHRLVAAARAVTNGLAFRIDPADPVSSLVEEAIRRASPSP